jgi:NADH-quinone oxidoreductase subunit C
MSGKTENLVQQVEQRFGTAITDTTIALGEVTITLEKDALLDTCTALRDEDAFAFELLIDLCGVDYSEYGETPWSRDRYAVVYHLLSVANNQRLRVKVFLPDDDMPRIDSVTDIWTSANWFEREAFDLYGIVFEGHPDLRRLLTDYGFIGHPFRKDFPLSGNVEMRYDPEKQRVVYEPVSIEPRILVPRVIRHDHRYESQE